MIYGIFNEQGRIMQAVNDSTILELPENAKLLTEEQWRNRFDLMLVNDELIDSPAEAEILTPEQLIAEQLSQINRDSEKAIKAITQTYPASEVLSWPKQEQEARAFTAGQAQTPLIDALAEARSVEKEYLVEKIIEKADQFAVISGALIGKRQKLEDQLNALPSDASAEMIAAIKWD